MSELEKLRQEFEAKKKELQDSCPHAKLSGWIEHWWAPGHSSGYCVKICARCGKIIEKRDHGDIPLEERPYMALPYEIGRKILEMATKERISLEDAQKRYFSSVKG